MRKTITIVGILAVLGGGMSCTNKKHLCPGLGQNSAADMSQFDENGDLIEDKKKRKKKVRNGLINKKEPKALHKK